MPEIVKKKIDCHVIGASNDLFTGCRMCFNPFETVWIKWTSHWFWYMSFALFKFYFRFYVEFIRKTLKQIRAQQFFINSSSYFPFLFGVNRLKSKTTQRKIWIVGLRLQWPRPSTYVHSILMKLQFVDDVIVENKENKYAENLQELIIIIVIFSQNNIFI